MNHEAAGETEVPLPRSAVTRRWNRTQHSILIMFLMLSDSHEQAVHDIQRALQTTARLPAVKEGPLDIAALDLGATEAP